MADKLTTVLWFDNNEARNAAEFYARTFPDSRVGDGLASATDTPSGPQGQEIIVSFTVCGQPFAGLNGGPMFKFNEAISFQVNCETQAEVAHYWGELSKGGDEKAQMCGWLKDRYGVSWQIVPRVLIEMINDPDAERSGRVMAAMLQMKKIDIEKLKQAYAGSG